MSDLDELASVSQHTREQRIAHAERNAAPAARHPHYRTEHHRHTAGGAGIGKGIRDIALLAMLAAACIIIGFVVGRGTELAAGIMP